MVNTVKASNSLPKASVDSSDTALIMAMVSLSSLSSGYEAKHCISKLLKSKPSLKKDVLKALLVDVAYKLNNVRNALYKARPSINHVNVLSDLINLFGENETNLVAAAESAMTSEEYAEAVRLWQKVASVLNQNMPQAYYDRLKEAYTKQKSFPKGSDEEEYLSGSIDKHEFLEQLHQTLKPKFYLEIGVQTGKSLALARCKAIGIDPMPMITQPLNEQTTIFEMSSDEFFENYAQEFLKEAPDLVFIDGMHLFEYALRDFINIEKFAKPGTVVVVDDIFPGHPAQAARERRTRAWTGDVWKLYKILESERQDLLIQDIDAYPTGLIIIQNLNPNSTILQKRYQNITKTYLKNKEPPKKFIDRDKLTNLRKNDLGDC